MLIRRIIKILSKTFHAKLLHMVWSMKLSIQATDITYDKYGHASFTVLKDGRKAGSFYLKVPGSHNVSNALAAIALARLLQIPNDVIVKGLGSFTGTDRRFQYKGEVAGVTIVDDYAHHPTEIQATLNAAHNYPHKKLWCVFQPHTYTRTKALLPEFAQALKLADHVVLADIYAARETDNLGISSKDLQARIQELGTPCEYFPTFDEIENFLLNNCEAGDLLITMGAGDVVKIGEQLLGKYDCNFSGCHVLLRPGIRCFCFTIFIVSDLFFPGKTLHTFSYPRSQTVFAKNNYPH